MRFARIAGGIATASMLALAAGCAEDVDDYDQMANEIAPDDDCEFVELLAGQTEVVGEVEVCENEYIDVTYRITAESWCIKDTHLHLAEHPGDFPTTGDNNRGRGNAPTNPIPGQFDYSGEPEDVKCAEVVEYTGLEHPSSKVYVAAHAEVKKRSGERVVNGSFEEPVVEHAAGWNIFVEDDVPGWNVEWTDEVIEYYSPPEEAYIELQRPDGGEIPENWKAHDKYQYTELDSDFGGPGTAGGDPASVILSQEIDTADYDKCRLKYAWSPRPGHDDNEMEVRVDGTKVGFHTGDATGEDATDWTPETEGFEPSATTLLEFEETGEPDSFGMFLDAVSVNCKRTESAWGANVVFDIDETLYLSDVTAIESPTEVLDVELDDEAREANVENLEALEAALQDSELEDRSLSLAHAPDRDVIYVVTSGFAPPVLGLYDVDQDALYTTEIDYSPVRLVQAATAPDGTLYVGSRVDDGDNQVHSVEFELDEGAGELTAEIDESFDLGIDIVGGDLAITAAGVVYMWTNAAANHGLHLIDLENEQAHAIDVPDLDGRSVSGLAVRNGGHGYLVASEVQSDNLHLINPVVGNTRLYDFVDFSHNWGDMTKGQFAEVDSFGTRFNEQRGSWATYFKVFE